MSNINEETDEVLGERNDAVLKIIQRITKSRGRACYQNVLAFAQREDENIQADDIKLAIDRLIFDGLVYDLNKDKPKKNGRRK